MSLLKRMVPTAPPSPRTAREAAVQAARLARYRAAVAQIALAQARRQQDGGRS